ncbi:MAG: J domain-containing protein [Polyangiaceae bacterium]
MSSALFAPVCAIAATRRRRFLWAAWWTAAPVHTPFRKPDASEGGARTREEALRAAERAAGCALQEIESGWARAWSKVLVGKEPWPSKRPGDARDQPPRARSTATPKPSIWHTLGLTPEASLVDIKRAYRLRALEVHPDRGGTDQAFRALHSAYESALKRRKHVKKAR